MSITKLFHLSPYYARSSIFDFEVTNSLSRMERLNQMTSSDSKKNSFSFTAGNTEDTSFARSSRTSMLSRSSTSSLDSRPPSVTDFVMTEAGTLLMPLPAFEEKKSTKLKKSKKSKPTPEAIPTSALSSLSSSSSPSSTRTRRMSKGVRGALRSKKSFSISNDNRAAKRFLRSSTTNNSRSSITGTKAKIFNRSGSTPDRKIMPHKRRRVYTPLSNKKKGKINTKGDKLWRHFYCFKTDNKKYSAGVLTQSEVSEKNLERIKDLLDEMKRVSRVDEKKEKKDKEKQDKDKDQKDSTQTSSNQLLHQYPATTFFLARVRHQLIYYEPNSGLIRVWSPSKSMNETETKMDVGENENENKNDSTNDNTNASNASNASSTSSTYDTSNTSSTYDTTKKTLIRKTSRRKISAMMMSDLDTPGFLRPKELIHLLNYHTLVRDTEISDCNIGLKYLMQTTFPLFRMMSILLNEMPMVVVSSNPNRLIQVMSTLLSLLRPFKWQHMYIPVIPTSCANMIGGAIDPSKPFLVGCDQSVLRVLEGEIKSTAIRSSLDMPGITVVRLDVTGGGAAKVNWGREFDNERDGTNILLQKMKPITTGVISESFNPLHRKSGGKGGKGSNRGTAAHRRSLNSGLVVTSNTSKTMPCVQIPTRYAVVHPSKTAKSSFKKNSKKKKNAKYDVAQGDGSDGYLSEISLVARKSMYKLFEDMMTLYPLFIHAEDNTFDIKTYVKTCTSIRPDCERFIRKFVYTKMFDAYLQQQCNQNINQSNNKGQEIKGNAGNTGNVGNAGNAGNTSNIQDNGNSDNSKNSNNSSNSATKNGGVDSKTLGTNSSTNNSSGKLTKKINEVVDERSAIHAASARAVDRLRKASVASASSGSSQKSFETKFKLSITRELNILIVESGMSVNVQKMGHLYVADIPLVVENDSKPIPEKVLKLSEKKRYIVLDRQRLTYYNTRSTKKVKGVIKLDYNTTRMSIAPPLPIDTQGMVVYTKPFTIKIENDEQKIVLYLRATDEKSFVAWYQALQIRLMPDTLRTKMLKH